ncbi:MAG TPA: hypothetical protein VE967_14245 [Gemmatimonadaceae bacterium]|nr:hypothetical protein [Gemmatimonadaceae bacterium]
MTVLRKAAYGAALASALSLTAATLCAQDSAATVQVDQALARRWAMLHLAVLGEYRTHNESAVGQIQADFSTREIRVGKMRGKTQVWASRTLTRKELEQGDLDAIAAELFAARDKGTPDKR